MATLLNPATDRDAEVKARRAFYRTEEGIVAFVREVLNAEPTPYQEDTLRMFVSRTRLAVRAPHGAGKTTISAWIVLWGMCCWDVNTKIITTASAWRQVERYTWPEIHLWASRANFERVGVTIRPGKELLALQLKLPGNKEAFGVASDTPGLIEGAHAALVIYVFDEAKLIPAGIFDAAEGAFSNAGEDTEAQAFALAISTPGDPSGRFYDICTRRPGTEAWATRHITLEEAIAAGRISRQWVEQCKLLWGENSAIFHNRVLGEFDTSGEGSVIPLQWVEMAHERFRLLEGKYRGDESYGVDPAYKGEDKSTIARLTGRVLTSLESYGKKDTMWVAGRIAASTAKNIPGAVDTIGIGAGVFDRLYELGFSVESVNVSERAVESDGSIMRDVTGERSFLKKRDFVWWLIRDALDPNGDDPLALPPDDELTGDLTAPRYEYTSDGKIKVESKDDLRARLGRSPDKADALGLALYAARFTPFYIV